MVVEEAVEVAVEEAVEVAAEEAVEEAAGGRGTAAGGGRLAQWGTGVKRAVGEACTLSLPGGDEGDVLRVCMPPCGGFAECELPSARLAARVIAALDDSRWRDVRARVRVRG